MTFLRLWIMYNLIFALCALSASAEGPQAFYETSLELAPSDSPTILSIDYSAKCNGLHRALAGTVIRQDSRRVRFELFSAVEHVEVLLGRIESGESIRIAIDKSPGCSLVEFHPRVEQPLTKDPQTRMIVYEDNLFANSSIERLVLQHAPYIVIRPDQATNRQTDLPLMAAYALKPNLSGGFTIQYLAVFTDEDSLRSKGIVALQMARYGRRTDIEWIYEVDFDVRGRVIGRHYHSSALFGILHSKKRFQGQFLEGTLHPILYNFRDNNVFSDRPLRGHSQLALEGYHLVPRRQVEHPKAREWLMFENPWMFDVSDAEMLREGKLTHASSDYLYVMIDGKLHYGSFIGAIQFNDGSEFASEPNVATMWNDGIDRFGEDLWKRQTFTAIPLGRQLLERITQNAATGNFKLLSAALLGTLIDVYSLRFFRLATNDTGRFEAEELTDRFSCSYEGLASHCSF